MGVRCAGKVLGEEVGGGGRGFDLGFARVGRSGRGDLMLLGWACLLSYTGCKGV